MDWWVGGWVGELVCGLVGRLVGWLVSVSRVWSSLVDDVDKDEGVCRPKC